MLNVTTDLKKEGKDRMNPVSDLPSPWRLSQTQQAVPFEGNHSTSGERSRRKTFGSGFKPSCLFFSKVILPALAILAHSVAIEKRRNLPLTSEWVLVNGIKPTFSPKRQASRNLSTDAGHLSPIGKSPGSEDSMRNCFEMMTTDSEQVLNGTVKGEKSLGVGH